MGTGLGMSKFTVDYFIEKFEGIVHQRWYVGDFVSPSGKRFCAAGHCGMRHGKVTKEGEALVRIFRGLSRGKIILGECVSSCSDGMGRWAVYEKTPRRRILKRLREIKAETGE